MDYMDPVRNLFMEVYYIRNRLWGWKNNKEKTGFMIDTDTMGNTEHKGAR